jgi:predicted negative regulator of RcsB-dependent stress response
MVRHPSARRVHRPVESSDDKFVAGVLESSAWAKRHSRVLIGGGIVLVVVLLGVLVYRAQTSATRERAALELERVRGTALAGDPATAVGELEAYVAQYGNTPAGREARLLLAQAHLEAGQPQQAIEATQGLARDADSPLGAPAGFLLAAAHEATGATDRAEEAYLRVASGARFEYQRLEALDRAALLRLDAGNYAGAAELFQRAYELIPEERAADRAVFRMRHAEAEARAQAGAGSN